MESLRLLVRQLDTRDLAFFVFCLRFIAKQPLWQAMREYAPAAVVRPGTGPLKAPTSTA